MKLPKINCNRFFIVLNIAIIASILNVLHVILGYAQTPPGQIYLGTGHYYLDFFEYLHAVSQGMRGNWFFENYFINEPAPNILFGKWQYLMIGKVGNIFHFSTVFTYWLSVVILSIVFSLLIFKIISSLLSNESFNRQLIAYILTLFAAPFFLLSKNTTGIKIIVFEFWNDKSVIFKRFGSLPHYYLSNIIILLTMLLAANTINEISALSKRSLIARVIIIVSIVLFLLTFSPSSFFLIVMSLFLTGVFLFIGYLKNNKKNIRRLLIFFGTIFFLILPIGILVKNYLTNDYYAWVSQVERAWQIHPLLTTVLLVTGPILIFALLGISNYFKKLTPIRILLLSFVLISYGVFFSEIAFYLGTTNTRFLTAISYILFGCLTALSLKRIKTLFYITILLLILFLPPNIETFRTMLTDRNIFSPITYLPKGMMDGFNFLDNISDNRVVLTSPSQFLSMVVPTFTGKYVYLFRPGGIDYQQRANSADAFYLGLLDDKSTEDFIKKNNIGFVILTSIEGYSVYSLRKYSFLKEIYKNNDIVIFEVKDKIIK